VTALATPESSPPPNAEVEFVRTRVMLGSPTQCAAVSTLVGPITTPVQSVLGVRTAAVKPHSWRFAA
jgi:hypothetical protein